MQGAVKAAGPLYALLGFALLPFIWSMPEALVCAELASAFPENSGYVVWVEAAFGPFAGFLEGLFSWISGVTDNTIYPVMLVAYMQQVVPQLQAWWVQKCATLQYLQSVCTCNCGAACILEAVAASCAFSVAQMLLHCGHCNAYAHIRLMHTRASASACRSVLLASSAAMIYLNYRGLDVVGFSTQVITVLTLAPFVLLTLLALPVLQPSRWLEAKAAADANWVDYFNIMFWCLNSWDSISTLAGEVQEPGKLLPRALACAVPLARL